MRPGATILVVYFFMAADASQAHPYDRAYPACGDEPRNEPGELLATGERNESLPGREEGRCFGNVEVEFDVDDTGNVTHARITSSAGLKIFRTMIFELVYATDYTP